MYKLSKLWNKTYQTHQQAMYTGIQDPCKDMEGSPLQLVDKWIWHSRVLFGKPAWQHPQNPQDELLQLVSLDQQNQPVNK